MEIMWEKIFKKRQGPIPPELQKTGFLQNNFNLKPAIAGGLIMATVAYTLNSRGLSFTFNNRWQTYVHFLYTIYEDKEAMHAAIAQGMYSFAMSGFITRLSEKVAYYYKSPFVSSVFAGVYPATITTLITAGMHSTIGSPRPFKTAAVVLASTICTMSLYGYIKRRALEKMNG